jgi:hypothetical protein
VKSVGASTINLGLITATSGGIGHVVTIDSTGGSILHVKVGTDIDGGVVNLWGSNIDINNLVVLTTNPPVYCNGSACVYGSGGGQGGGSNSNLFSSLQTVLIDQETKEKTELLTCGVLPEKSFGKCVEEKAKGSETADSKGSKKARTLIVAEEPSESL